MKSGVVMIGLFFVIMLTGFVLAADVAYVVKDYNQVDFNIWFALEELNLDIDIVTDSMIMDTDFSAYSFVLVGDGWFKHLSHVPEMPLVLTNSRYAEHFGFLDMGRTKRAGSSSNLMVKVLGNEIDVYDMPSMKLGGVALTFDYLPMKFMNDDLVNYASTASPEVHKMGSVVAFEEDKDMCYFGIGDSDFWNVNSGLLFSDCVKTAMDVDVIESHNVGIKEDHTDSVNGLRLKHVDTGVALLDEVSELECGERYKVDYVTQNLGDFTEDVMFTGMLGDFMWTATKTDLTAGSSTTTGSKTFTIDDTFSNGDYTLEVVADIGFDDDPSDNMRSRMIEVVGC